MFEELHRKMNAFWNNDRTLSQTDPEFVKLFSDFAYDEVINEPGANHPDLDDQTRSLAILAALVGCQGNQTGRRPGSRRVRNDAAGRL